MYRTFKYDFQHPEVTHGNQVICAICDTGSVMTTELKSQNIEPSFAKEVGNRTYLGFATRYALVKQCGGNITMDSEVGEHHNSIIWLLAVFGGLSSRDAKFACHEVDHAL